MAGRDDLRLDAQIDGTAVWIRVAGEVDAATAPALADALFAAADAGHDEVVLDCSRLEFIDSSGLNVLVAAHKRCQTMGGVMTVVSPPPAARRLFGISGVDRILTIRE